MAIIAISGRIGAGKDEVAKIIQNLDPTNNWQIKKFAGPLKKITSILTGLSLEALEDQGVKATPLGEDWGNITPRFIFQKLGTEGVRDLIHPDAWVNSLFKDYTDGQNWIITDLRFPNEVKRCLRYKNSTLIKVVREIPKSTDAPAHVSETALDDYDKWSHVIFNDGTKKDLILKVKNILNDKS